MCKSNGWLTIYTLWRNISLEQNDPLIDASNRVYVCQDVDILPDGERFRRFVPEQSIHYYPLCDDFGPMNLASVIKFVRQLDSELEAYPESIFFYCADTGKRALTNAVFLLGSYMILRLDLTVAEVSEDFSWLGSRFAMPHLQTPTSTLLSRTAGEVCPRGSRAAGSTCRARATRITAGDSSTWTSTLTTTTRSTATCTR